MFFTAKLIDKNLFLETIDRDQSLLETLISLFEEQSRDNINSMRDALRTKNNEQFERAAHDLKNLGRNIASEKLVEHSHILETLAAERKIIEAGKLLDQTEKLLGKAQKELIEIQKTMIQ